MTWWIWLCIVLGVLLIALVVVAWAQAGRIDRLHRRIAQARLSLDRHLVKRSADAVRLADTPVLASTSAASLREAAAEALSAAQYPLAADSLGGFARQGAGDAADSAARVRAESRLSQVLREELTDEVRAGLSQTPTVATQVELLDSDSYRVRVSRNLHNQDVASVRRLRSRPLARALHLSGHAPSPEFVDFDDE